MRKAISLLLSSLLCFQACTPTNAINYVAVNELLEDKNVTVHTYDGIRRVAESVQITADTVSWFDAVAIRPFRVPTDSVQKIVLISRWGGATDGFFLGGLAGLPIGAIAAIVAGPGAGEMGELQQFIYFGAGVMFSAVVGLAIGASLGHTMEFYLR